MFKSIALFLLSLTTFLVLGQKLKPVDVNFKPLHIHYTINDGLPSNEIYDLIQDDSKNLWIATDRGISKYDGYSFKNYTTADGLVDNTVFKFVKSKNNTIYYYTYSGEIGWIRDEQFFSFSNNKILKEIIRDDVIDNMIVSKNNDLYIVSRNLAGQYIKISNLKDISVLKFKGGEAGISIKKIDDQYLVSKTTLNNISFEKGDIESYYELDIGLEQVTKKVIIHDKYLVVLADNKIRIIDHESEKVIKTHLFNEYITHLINDNDILYISTKDKSFSISIQHLLEREPSEKDIFLKSSKLNKVFKDHNGGVWYASINNGLFYRSSNFPEKLDLLNEFKYIESDMKLVKNRSLLISNHTYFYKFDIKNEQCEFLKQNSIIRFISVVDSNVFISLNGERPNYLVGNELDKEILKNSLLVYDIETSANYRWVLSFNLFRSKKSKSIEKQIVRGGCLNVLIGQKLFCMKVLNDENALIGTRNGLYLVQKTNESFVSKKISSNKINTRVQTIEKVADKYLIGTLGEGIVVLNHKMNFLQRITIGEGLSSNLINNISVKENNVYISTIKGIDHFYLSRDSVKFKYSINKEMGFDFLNCKKSIALDSQLVIQSHLGFLRYSLATKSNVNSKLFFNPTINQLKVIDKDTIYRFDFNHNPIAISFNPINFNTNKNPSFQYSIKEGKWINCSSNVNFSDLGTGNQTINLRAKFENGIWNYSENSIKLYIKPPYWMTWWFIGLSILIILSGVYLITIRLIKNKQRKSLLIIRSQKAELKALRLQMNPHFLFNVMSSLQFLVLNGKTKDAVLAISSFARMLRKVLKYSDKKWISLKEEVELILDYAELEKNRVSNAFDFFIDYEGVDTEKIKIPPMLIQPFIENSIWHGVDKLVERKAKINLKFLMNDSGLVCIIEDNGRGRQLTKSRENKELSYGLSIIQNRLNIWTKERRDNKKYDFKFTDLKDDLNRPLGTIVRIKLPFKKND